MPIYNKKYSYSSYKITKIARERENIILTFEFTHR